MGLPPESRIPNPESRIPNRTSRDTVVPLGTQSYLSGQDTKHFEPANKFIYCGLITINNYRMKIVKIVDCATKFQKLYDNFYQTY